MYVMKCHGNKNTMYTSFGTAFTCQQVEGGILVSFILSTLARGAHRELRFDYSLPSMFTMINVERQKRQPLSP